MQLDSYLEIFTTMYGWAFANIFGEIIVGTGLVILPFAVIIFNGWRDAREQGMQHAGVLALIERVSTQLIIALFVMSVCFATTPLTSLSNVNLTYTPPTTVFEPSPVAGSRNGGTGSGYDQAMRDASDGSMSNTGNLAFVPPWWYTVMAISSGVNNAFRNGLRNGTSDIRMVEDMARHSTIEDPKVLNSVQRFYSECFVPARSKYLAMNKADISPAGAALVDPTNKPYGPGDVDWMGSQLFRTEDGFYSAMRSSNPVPGFAIDFSRDTDYYNPASPTADPPSGQVNPEWGRPTCKQWWEDSDKGVRKQMVSHSSISQKLLDAAGSAMTWSSDDQRLDSFAKLAQAKANPNFVDQDKITGTEYDTTTKIGRILASGATTVGVGMTAMLAGLEVVPLMTSLPMIQALVLMGIYMFLPLITFLSGFNLRIMFYGAVAIFTVKMWAAMWFISQWIDARMINAMYPGAQGNVFLQEITHLTSGAIPQGYKRMLLNILMMTLFIGLPIIWTAMMAWIGVNIGAGITNLTASASDTAKQSASKTGGAGTKGKIR